MTERAAHLMDEVLPRVPVRQWVLTLPYRLRYRLAWDHALSRAVLGVYARGARERRSRDGRTGTVTVIQRSASGLNLNVLVALIFTALSCRCGQEHQGPGLAVPWPFCAILRPGHVTTSARTSPATTSATTATVTTSPANVHQRRSWLQILGCIEHRATRGAFDLIQRAVQEGGETRFTCK